MVKVVSEVKECEQCPFSKSRKVYTADSFEDVRAVFCEKLGKDVYGYLDWNESSTVPNYCPFIETK